MEEFIVGPGYKEQAIRLLWLYENAKKGVGLDIGCADGSTLAIAMAQSREGNKVFYKETEGMIGIDKDESLRANFHKHHPRGSFFTMDVQKQTLPFPDNCFDTVLLCEILEHTIPFYTHKLIDEAYRVSRGVVLITTPDGTRGPLYAADRVEAEEHSMIFTEEIFRNFLEPSEDMIRWYKLWPWAPKTEMKYKYELIKDGIFIFIKLFK